MRGARVLLSTFICSLIAMTLILSKPYFMFVGSNLAEMDFLEEIKLMKNIGQHPHIVNFVGCITISTPFCLIVEYCTNGDLLNYLKKGHHKVV